MNSCAFPARKERGLSPGLDLLPLVSLPPPLPHLSRQIYNEMIRDLLNPSLGYLELREDARGVIRVAGITEVSTINAKEASFVWPAWSR